MDYSYVATDTELEEYITEFLGRNNFTIALDMEMESNRHSFGEKLCLIQIHDGTQTILIDPLHISEDTIRKLLENKNVLKVMYDASYDSIIMKSLYSIEIKSILDLKPAVDLLKYKKGNLHSVIAQELGIQLKDKDKYQKHNWMIRPISNDALEYAMNDVLYLLPLKKILLKKIFDKELMDRFLLRNFQIQLIEQDVDTEKKYKNVRGYNNLDANEKHIFQTIYDIRKEYAEMYNLPDYRIIRNDDLIRTAKDTNHLNRIQFPVDLSVNGIREILKELKAAVTE
ncbi:hypothetical protein ACFLUG_04980 [Chloroflexota bacterium]